MKETEIPNCRNCEAKLIKHPQKDYYVCPNWRPNNAGCEGDIWRPKGDWQKTYPNVVFSVKVESKSQPGHYHQVKVYESGDVYCPCWAGSTDKFCRHKKIMVEQVEKLLTKIKRDNLTR